MAQFTFTEEFAMKCKRPEGRYVLYGKERCGWCDKIYNNIKGSMEEHKNNPTLTDGLGHRLKEFEKCTLFETTAKVCQFTKCGHLFATHEVLEKRNCLECGVTQPDDVKERLREFQESYIFKPKGNKSEECKKSEVPAPAPAPEDKSAQIRTLIELIDSATCPKTKQLLDAELNRLLR